MKKQVLLAGLLAMNFIQSHAQFQRAYGTQSTEIGRSLTRTYDNGYVFAGLTREPYLGNGDASLTKTDINGNPLWSKVYGGQMVDQFNSVRFNTAFPNSQVAYVAAGLTNSFPFGDPGTTDMYLVGTDINGNQLFSKVIGGKQTDVAYCVQSIIHPIDGPGYVVVGETNSFGLAGNLAGTNVFVVRTDLAGNLKDARVLGTKHIDKGHWIEQTSDRGYIIAGFTYAPVTAADINLNNPNILVIKLDANFNLQWNRIISGPQAVDDVAYCVKEFSTTNNQRGYTLTGYTRNHSNGGEDAFLLSLGLQGNFLWMRTYGRTNNERGFSLLQTKNPNGQEEYIVAGRSASFSASTDAYLFKTTLAGNLIWTRIHGGSREDYHNEIIHGHVPGPGYATTGVNSSFNGLGNNDYALTAMNNAGNSFTNCEFYSNQGQIVCQPPMIGGIYYTKVAEIMHVNSLVRPVQFPVRVCNTTAAREAFEGGDVLESMVEESNEIVVAPNPVVGALLTMTVPAGFETASMKIMDMEGQIVKEDVLSGSKISIPVEGLEKGIYIIQLTNDAGEIRSNKFIVQ